MAKIEELVKAASSKLKSAGIENERMTASLLLAEILGRDTIYIIAHNRDEVATETEARFQRAVERRCSGEPLQYITGRQEFYKRNFIVNPSVLIPRPETELIVEKVVNLCKELDLKSPTVLDIGTGSGCIAISIASEIAEAAVFAIDISTLAIEVAKRNSERHQVDRRVHFFVGDLTSAIFPEIKFDFCCTNPPYIDPNDRSTLSREVKDFEPEIALFAQEKGLGLIARLLTECATITKPGGYFLCEIGFGQEEAVLAMVNREVWEIQPTIKDLQSIPRTVFLKRTL
ncbi:MAG: peptide chain release factor N(5)-glutamine methyltransferase [Blastocatellia bacterium]|nr:peptide chain release factor N(5)-glutamine methyltransferase [Blastocatellia bacterium]